MCKGIGNGIKPCLKQNAVAGAARKTLLQNACSSVISTEKQHQFSLSSWQVITNSVIRKKCSVVETLQNSSNFERVLQN